MRLITGFLLVLVAMPSIVSAACKPWSCYILNFEVDSCTFKTIGNEREVEEMIGSMGAQNAQFHEAWRGQISTVNGVELNISNPKYKKVPCREGVPLLAGDPEIGSKYFYLTDDKSSCSEFLAGENTKFFQGDCCDTLPPRPSCLTPPILSELPKSLGSHGGDEAMR